MCPNFWKTTSFEVIPDWKYCPKSYPMYHHPSIIGVESFEDIIVHCWYTVVFQSSPDIFLIIFHLIKINIRRWVNAFYSCIMRAFCYFQQPVCNCSRMFENYEMLNNFAAITNTSFHHAFSKHTQYGFRRDGNNEKLVQNTSNAIKLNMLTHFHCCTNVYTMLPSTWMTAIDQMTCNMLNNEDCQQRVQVKMNIKSEFNQF